MEKLAGKMPEIWENWQLECQFGKIFKQKTTK